MVYTTNTYICDTKLQVSVVVFYKQLLFPWSIYTSKLKQPNYYFLQTKTACHSNKTNSHLMWPSAHLKARSARVIHFFLSELQLELGYHWRPQKGNRVGSIFQFNPGRFFSLQLGKKSPSLQPPKKRLIWARSLFLKALVGLFGEV